MGTWDVCRVLKDGTRVIAFCNYLEEQTAKRMAWWMQHHHPEFTYEVQPSFSEFDDHSAIPGSISVLMAS